MGMFNILPEDEFVKIGDDSLKNITDEARVKRLYESVKHVDVKSYTPVEKFVFNGLSVPELPNIQETIIAKIISEKTKCIDQAFFKAVREYAEENGRTELFLIPEETLLRILKLGSAALIDEGMGR